MFARTHIATTILALGIAGACAVKPAATPAAEPQLDPQWATCANDGDCVNVAANCCGACPDAYRQWAIGRAHEQDAHERITRYCRTNEGRAECGSCPQPIAEHHAVCRDGTCRLP